MIETEVSRLRRLRCSALRVRAVARALAASPATQDDPVLSNAACAAWRVARAVSGRLRAHPYANFQRDVGIGSIVTNSVIATAAALTAANRTRALKCISDRVRQLLRELEDARAVTLTPDLSDSFGRSLAELRPLLALAENELRVARHRKALPAGGVIDAAGYGSAAARDWPYMAL